MTLRCPLDPFRGIRESDAFGSGVFGASRTRAGVSYGHKGLDLIALEGDAVYAPMRALVQRHGWAYADQACNLRSIHLLADDGTAVKILYAMPVVEAGVIVEAGTMIARAQNVAAWHMRHAGDPRKMINHIHVEVAVHGRLVDPVLVMDLPTVAMKPTDVT